MTTYTIKRVMQLVVVLHQDYIRTAWSKGLNQRAVIVGHALKNAGYDAETRVKG